MYCEQILLGVSKMDRKNVKVYMKHLAAALKALNENNDTQRNFLSDEQITSLGPVIQRTLILVQALRVSTQKVIQKKRQNQEIDDEDIEQMKRDLAKVSDVATQVMELTGQLSDCFKDRAFPVVRDYAVDFFSKQLNQYDQLTEDELIDALCFFCDYIEHTQAHNDAKLVNEISQKFRQISEADPEAELNGVSQTICYGFGVFGINLPNGAFKELPYAVQRCKEIVRHEEAFSEDNLIITESTLGAIAKMAYNHMDGKLITHADLTGVLSKMPFTAFDGESCTSHRHLIDQWLQPTSHVHNGKVE